MNLFEKGVLGESRAALYLRRQGMRILERRFRAAHSEIDLICQDGETTVFVEVKFRPTGKMGEGVTAVNAEKRRHIRSAASAYLQAHRCTRVRFDVVEISEAGVRHIRNAF